MSAGTEGEESTQQDSQSLGWMMGWTKDGSSIQEMKGQERMLRGLSNVWFQTYGIWSIVDHQVATRTSTLWAKLRWEMQNLEFSAYWWRVDVITDSDKKKSCLQMFGYVVSLSSLCIFSPFFKSLNTIQTASGGNNRTEQEIRCLQDFLQSAFSCAQSPMHIWYSKFFPR